MKRHCHLGVHPASALLLHALVLTTWRPAPASCDGLTTEPPTTTPWPPAERASDGQLDDGQDDDEHRDEEEEEEEEEEVAVVLDPLGGLVSCAHVERLARLDASLLEQLSPLLGSCWRRGVTLDEAAAGAGGGREPVDTESRHRRGYADLYLDCGQVFAGNLSKLTSSLLEDYLGCREAGALDEAARRRIEARFKDVIEAYETGNGSATIDESTLVSCANATRALIMHCRDYGLTATQTSRGFLGYLYPDKWAVEEEPAELSLTCDRVFAAGLEAEAYPDEAEAALAFVRCSGAGTTSWEPEVRDTYEKRNAARVMRWRALESSSAFDLRSYVSCRHLRPVQLGNALISPSMHARGRCLADGATYDELRAGVEHPLERRSPEAIDDMYVGCGEVFGEELGSLTTALLDDYGFCAEAGALDKEALEFLRGRFGRLFERLEGTREFASDPKAIDGMVSCAGFTGKLEELCRRLGSTFAHELRGVGGLSRDFGDLWLNTDDLDELYLRCDDVFDKYIKYLDAVPVTQYMQCLWTDGLGELGQKFIGGKINRLYEDSNRDENKTRIQGDIDIAITSAIMTR